MMTVQICSIAVAVTLCVVSAQTFPTNICSGGVSDYVGTHIFSGSTTCNAFLVPHLMFSPPSVWTEQTCKTAFSGTSTWANLLATAQAYGCCTSYVSACAQYTAPANECSGGQPDFLGSATAPGGNTCGMQQYSIESAFANVKVPPSSGTWTAEMCAQSLDGTTSGATVSYYMNGFLLPNCCKSGKSACDKVTPAAAPTTTTSASCFSGEDTVQIASGSSKLFSELSVGDKVLTANSVGELSFADVVFLPHAKNDDVANFVQLSTKSGKSIKATQMHLLQVCSGKLDYAKNLKLGDCLRTVDGDDQISSVSNMDAKGLYTAVTTNEFLVVNGVIASPFAVAHVPTHAFYNIHRALYVVAPGLLQQKSLVSANALLGTSAAFAYSLVTSSVN